MWTHNSSKGLTLLEMLLSMVIASFMIAAVAIIFTGALRDWKVKDPKLLLHQEATIAMNKIERQLKKAGSIYYAGDKSVVFTPLALAAPEVDGYTISLWHFDEGSGTTANDETGTNNGTLKASGEPAWVGNDNGESKDALRFDGNDDYVDCGNGATLRISDKLTLEAWLQPDSGVSGSGAIIYMHAAYRLYLNDSGYLVGGIYYSCDWHDIISNRTVQRNSSTWAHTALTYDKDEETGEELKLYINGHNVATANHTNFIATSSDNLCIGYDGTNNQYPFEGVIDEVRVSNDVRRTRIFWQGNPVDKPTLEVNGISHQLVHECNTDTFVVNYYDEDYDEVTDTSTQAKRNSIKIVKILLGLKKDTQKFSLKNTITLRKELPGEAEEEGGLVGYWKMNEYFWNGTAGEVIDSSGNNNHGTAKNGANTVASGKIGRCGYFDGNNDYVDVGSVSSLDVNKVTVMAWVNVNLYHGGKILCKSPQNSTNIDFVFSIGTDAKAYFRHYDGSSWHGVGSNDRMYSDHWYHIAGTFDGTSWKIYIDGEVNGVTNDEVALSTGGALEIGRYYHSTPRQYFDGLIDEVKIYNRALSGEEIKEAAFGFTDSKKDDFTGTYDDTIWERDYVGLEHP